MLIWTGDNGWEVWETVAWSGLTADEAIETLAAYCPARWLPTETGYTLTRVEVRLGRFVETRHGPEIADVEWRDDGPTRTGDIDHDTHTITWAHDHQRNRHATI